MASNLRGGPLFLRPSVVRQLVGDIAAIRQAVVQVPLLPIKLVDRPRASEDPRLAKANDDITELPVAPDATVVASGSDRVAPTDASAPVVRIQAEEPEPSDWPDAPLPEHGDPDLDRPEPANIEGRDAAILAGYKAGALVGDLATQFGLSRWTIYDIAKRHGLKRANGIPASPEIAARNAEVAKAYAAGEPVSDIMARFNLGRANVYKIGKDAGIEREKKVAPVSRSISARARQTPKQAIAAPVTTKSLCSRPPVEESGLAGMAARECASQTQLVQPDRLRNTAGEKHSPTVTGDGFYSEAAAKRRAQQAGIGRARADRQAEESRRNERRSDRAAADAAAIEDFQAALAKARARREAGVEIIAPKRAAPVASGAKLAEALRQRSRAAPARLVQVTPLEPALSREECPRCGIPGWKGCDHFLPCEDQPKAPPEERYVEDRKSQQFTGRRQGIGASRL